jgi:hypothetical protein
MKHLGIGTTDHSSVNPDGLLIKPVIMSRAKRGIGDFALVKQEAARCLCKAATGGRGLGMTTSIRHL